MGASRPARWVLGRCRFDTDRVSTFLLFDFDADPCTDGGSLARATDGQTYEKIRAKSIPSTHRAIQSHHGD